MIRTNPCNYCASYENIYLVELLYRINEHFYRVSLILSHRLWERTYLVQLQLATKEIHGKRLGFPYGSIFLLWWFFLHLHGCLGGQISVKQYSLSSNKSTIKEKHIIWQQISFKIQLKLHKLEYLLHIASQVTTILSVSSSTRNFLYKIILILRCHM